MKLTIDTEKETIQLHHSVNIYQLMNYLEENIGNWADYDLVVPEETKKGNLPDLGAPSVTRMPPTVPYEVPPKSPPNFPNIVMEQESDSKPDFGF